MAFNHKILIIALVAGILLQQFSVTFARHREKSPKTPKSLNISRSSRFNTLVEAVFEALLSNLVTCVDGGACNDDFVACLSCLVTGEVPTTTDSGSGMPVG